MKREFTIDLAGVRTPDALHDALASALPLPPDCGRNLDALYDVLTEYGADWRIVFRNAAGIGRPFRAVCRDAMAATPGLEIVFPRRRRKS